MSEKSKKTVFFDVYGPFDIARTEKECTRNQTSLWSTAEVQAEGLSSAIGCYLFGLKHGERITPWYIGMTIARDGFAAETFQKHKLEIYAEVMSQKRGAPVLFLFPLYTPSSQFSKGGISNKRTIMWLERTLMSMAFGRNPEISNVRDMTSLRTVEVLGLLGPKRIGRPYSEAQSIRRVLLGK